jgi:hypothetical protein
VIPSFFCSTAQTVAIGSRSTTCRAGAPNRIRTGDLHLERVAS